MAETSVVEIDRVDKWFGANQVLKQVSLSVTRAEVVVICGPSGSGKSTLLRCVNGLEPIDGGSIRMEGVKISGQRQDPRRLSTIVGMVFQQFNLFPHITVLQNLILAPLKVRRLPRQDAIALHDGSWIVWASRTKLTPTPIRSPAGNSSEPR
jgi:ABC-type polar amino acid transport system ATPase subunit